MPHMPGLPGSTLKYLPDGEKYKILEYISRMTSFQAGKRFCRQRHSKKKCGSRSVKKCDLIFQYWRKYYQDVVRFWVRL